MSDRVRRHAVVTGRVQGVGFRYAARQQADGLGLAGWVRNLASGEVELEVEGPRAGVEQFMDWLRDGPPAARVDSVDLEDLEPHGEVSGFTVTH